MPQSVKRSLLVITLVVAAIYLGVLSGLYIKPILVSWGAEKNWSWPVICIVVGSAIGVLFHQKDTIRISRKSIVQFLIGAVIGVIIQFGFAFAGQRGFPSFQAMPLTALLFQVCVSFAEEYLFREKLQGLLQGTVHYMFAAIVVSVPFAVVHGLNPVLFNSGSFDWAWFIGTLILSLAAGLAYGPKKYLSRAVGVHLAYNIIATFF